ncbi:MAG: DUF488 domain-containing protein [Rhodothermales bacterium]
MIQCKRAYDDPSPDDGTRVLVDRLWPRGVRKDEAQLDDWAKEVAPSDELRTWFDHDPEKWDEFRRRYHAELHEKEDTLAPLHKAAEAGTLTLVYAAKDRAHNNAVALKQYVDSSSD